MTARYEARVRTKGSPIRLEHMPTVVIYADNVKEARDKAIDLAWGGAIGEAQVDFVRIDEIKGD